jgi:hypothetical protein
VSNPTYLPFTPFDPGTPLKPGGPAKAHETIEKIANSSAVQKIFISEIPVTCQAMVASRRPTFRSRLSWQRVDTGNLEFEFVFSNIEATVPIFYGVIKVALYLSAIKAQGQSRNSDKFIATLPDSLLDNALNLYRLLIAFVDLPITENIRYHISTKNNKDEVYVIFLT